MAHPTSAPRLEEDLFGDFDGVHFSKTPQARDLSLSNPGQKHVTMSGFDEQHFIPESTRNDLVYYPAPVPVMLNLPPKLSSQNTLPPGKSKVPENARKKEPNASFRRSLGLPGIQPQKDISSVFDNILDATVAAPVLSVVSHSVTTAKPIGGGGGGGDHMHAAPKLTLPHHDINPKRNKEASYLGSVEDTTDGDLLPGIAVNPGDYPETDDKNRSAINSDPKTTNGDPEASGNSVLKDIIIEEPSGNCDGEVLEGTRIAGASHYPHSEHSQTTDDDLPCAPATLLAELESRKTQQRARTNKSRTILNGQQSSTLLERDALAEVKKEARKRGPVNLAGKHEQSAADDIDDDMPLGILFASKLSARPDDNMRAPGLLAMREAEDNEPLRKRQERLKQSSAPASQTIADHTDENETLGQRRQRLRAAQQNDQIDITKELELPAAGSSKTLNSMSEMLQSNPQKQTHNLQNAQLQPRGLLGAEMPFGYQAQQQMHVNLLGHPNSTRYSGQKQPQSAYQYDVATRYHARDSGYGIPFPYAPVNAEYLQQQQAILADQIERWRSSVW